MVLNPSAEKKERLEYFGELQKILDNGGREALMYFFEHYRAGKGGVDIRSAIKTQALIDQQDEGLEPFESWLLEEFLWTGVARCCGLENGMQINRGAMYEQYLDWHKQMNIRDKRLSCKKFWIKFGSYFPRYDKDGKLQKAKNGRVISIFMGNDTTNNDGHIYDFPSLKETRSIVIKAIGRADYDWEGGGIEWEAHPNSAHFGGSGKEKNDGPRTDAPPVSDDNVIPMHKK